MPVRSGRFKVADASGGIPIIQGRSGAFYRIFNSGEHNFTVKPNGPSTPTSQQTNLAPTFSIDIGVGTNGVEITGASGRRVEGIYDYLDPYTPIRSGRFKKSEDTNTPHKIIHLLGGGSAYYRIFNSGENTVVVEKDSGGSAAEITRLAQDQSFDFEVGVSLRDIYVRSVNADEPIEGIYDFLGKS